MRGVWCGVVWCGVVWYSVVWCVGGIDLRVYLYLFCFEMHIYILGNNKVRKTKKNEVVSWPSYLMTKHLFFFFEKRKIIIIIFFFFKDCFVI